LLDGELGKSTRDYLRHRDVTDETAARFQVGLALDGTGRLQRAASEKGIDRSLLLATDLMRQSEQGRTYETFRNRLMFPIRDTTGRVIGFGGRTLGDDRAKYINTSQNTLFDKGRNLYGIDLARTAIAERQRAIIVEGYTDCLAAHQAGFPETVATLGTALTEAQIKLLHRYCEEIILLFDADDAGEAAAERAIRVALPQCVTVRLAHIPDGKDPSEYLSSADQEAFSDVLNKAVDALEFKWSQTWKRYRGEASDTRRREAILDFLKVVAEAVDTSAVDAIQRGLLVNQVAHLIRADRDEVDRLMRRQQPSRVGGGTKDAGRAVPARGGSPSDGEQAAWTRVLEVLLSQPAALKSVDHVPDIARIANERDRRIAQLVFDLVDRPEGLSMADVLARCHDPADVERVTELARRGADLRQHEASLCSAFQRIAAGLEQQKLEQCKQGLLQSNTGQDADGGSTDAREIIQDGAKKHRHFAPRRLIRQSMDTEG
jgi:DNA primase